MKRLILILVTLHGLIHFMGFAKAFNYGNITQITKDISKTEGLFWLLTAVLFILTTILFLFKKESWPFIGIIASVFSQVLIIMVWKDAKLGTMVNLLLLLVAIPSIANNRFNRMADDEAKAILASIHNTEKTYVTKEMLYGLPPVVQKWLTHSGIIGKEKINTIRLKQKGEMRTKPESKWMPFEATQYFTVNEPAFVWTTDVQMMPFIKLVGWDKFENSQGAMVIKLLSLFKVADAKNTEKINSAAMIRYLAESSWFPTAALSEYIKWETVDSLSAKATMNFKGLTVSGIFHFTADGDMLAFSADRFYGTGKDATKERWYVQNTAWKDYNGIRIPNKGKLIWKLKEGNFNWLNLELTDLEFNKTELYKLPSN